MKEQELDPISETLPKEGWLARYVEFGHNLEACERFRFFTACCILGAVLNNKVWIQRGDPGLLPKLFPNLWVLLLAPPGRGKKTSTINMSVNCLYQACPEVRILADKLTPEALVRALSEPAGKEKIRIGPRDATGLIKAPELSVFFGKQQYNTGLVSLITDLYDFREEWTSETIMRGKNVLRRNCISVLGGSTPDWLQTMLPQDAFTGGFMSRFVIVEMPPKMARRVALPKRAENAPIWPEIVSDLRRFSSVKGEMEFTPYGRKAYVEYYESLVPTGDAQKDAYQEREPEQVLKLAMLLAISRGQMEVDDSEINQSLTLLRALQKEVHPRIEYLTTHPRMRLVQEIQDLLKFHDKLSKSELMKRLYRGLAYGETQFIEAIRILQFSGVIETCGGTPLDPIYRLRFRR